MNPHAGEVLHGEVYAPPVMQTGQKFPTILYVYGGPHIQVSSDDHYHFGAPPLSLVPSPRTFPKFSVFSILPRKKI